MKKWFKKESSESCQIRQKWEYSEENAAGFFTDTFLAQHIGLKRKNTCCVTKSLTFRVFMQSNLYPRLICQFERKEITCQVRS